MLYWLHEDYMKHRKNLLKVKKVKKLPSLTINYFGLKELSSVKSIGTIKSHLLLGSTPTVTVTDFFLVVIEVAGIFSVTKQDLLKPQQVFTISFFLRLYLRVQTLLKVFHSTLTHY